MHRRARKVDLWRVAVPAVVVLASTFLLITSDETGASPWLAASFIVVGILLTTSAFLRIRDERSREDQSRASSDGSATDEPERRHETPR